MGNPKIFLERRIKMKSMLMMVVVLVVAVSAQAIDVPNGDFETLYKPGTSIPGTISDGGFTRGVVGLNVDVAGVFEFFDGTTGDYADILGWVNEDGKGGITQRDSARSGNLTACINGGAWGQPGGLIISAESLGLADGTALNLSMWAKDTDDGGPALPVVLELLAGGSVISATSSVDSDLTLSIDWMEFTRTYDAATMAAVAGQDLTIRFGIEMGGGGAQTALDDVSLDLVGGGGTGNVNLDEFAEMAASWLVDYSSTGSMPR
jgi:hypothetical protein